VKSVSHTASPANLALRSKVGKCGISHLQVTTKA
jgi:hypothetical protein